MKSLSEFDFDSSDMDPNSPMRTDHAITEAEKYQTEAYKQTKQQEEKNSTSLADDQVMIEAVNKTGLEMVT